MQQVATYAIEFLEKDNDQPFFTAYTKSGSYSLPAKILAMKFTHGKIYQWRVRGFNAANELVAESPLRTFTLGSSSTFVPNQVLFIVDNNEAGLNLIPEITAKYDLEIIEQTELASLKRIMVLCNTVADVRIVSAQLATEPGLYGPQPNYIFFTMAGGDPLRSMQSIDKFIDLDRIHQLSSGKNVLVAIIDTGVDLNHRDLLDRIRAHENFLSNSSYQGEIHGTAVAGIIAGSRNDFGMLGIAPDAELFAYRACRQLTTSQAEGECYTSSIAKAIDAAIQAKASIANLSIGSGNEDSLVAELISTGKQQGMFFIAPVGNDPHADSIAFPASHPDVTAVAGFDDENRPLPNQKLAMGADALAPAHNIFSSTPGDKHNFFDGTSFSAAAISGLLALSLETHNGSVSGTLPHASDKALWQNQVTAYIGL